MKKILLFFIALTNVAIMFTFIGCSDKGTFEEQLYSSGDTTIKTLNINVSDREIEVVASDDSQIHIEYYESEKEYYDISVSENNELTMNLIYNNEWTDFIGSKSPAEYRKIRIEIPNDLLSGISIKTTNEAVRLSSLSVLESISLDSNGGDLVFEKIEVGKSLNVTAKNGNITGTVIGGWDDFSINCEIKKGDSNLPENKTGGEKSLTANCNNGNIDIDFIA